MSAPFTPDEFRSTIPDLNAPACEALDRMLVVFPRMWTRVYTDYFYGSGLCEDIQNMECPSSTDEATTDAGTPLGAEPTITTHFVCNEVDDLCPNSYKFNSAYAINGSITELSPDLGTCFSPGETVMIVAQVLGDDGIEYEISTEVTMGDGCS